MADANSSSSSSDGVCYTPLVEEIACHMSIFFDTSSTTTTPETKKTKNVLIRDERMIKPMYTSGCGKSYALTEAVAHLMVSRPGTTVVYLLHDKTACEDTKHQILFKMQHPNDLRPEGVTKLNREEIALFNKSSIKFFTYTQSRELALKGFCADVLVLDQFNDSTLDYITSDHLPAQVKEWMTNKETLVVYGMRRRKYEEPVSVYCRKLLSSPQKETVELVCKLTHPSLQRMIDTDAEEVDKQQQQQQQQTAKSHS